jgi:hypothetical protein
MLPGDGPAYRRTVFGSGWGLLTFHVDDNNELIRYSTSPGSANGEARAASSRVGRRFVPVRRARDGRVSIAETGGRTRVRPAGAVSNVTRSRIFAFMLLLSSASDIVVLTGREQIRCARKVHSWTRSSTTWITGQRFIPKSVSVRSLIATANRAKRTRTNPSQPGLVSLRSTFTMKRPFSAAIAWR